jgi:uncharacterized protein
MGATTPQRTPGRRDRHPFRVEVGALRHQPGGRRVVQLSGGLPGLAVSGSAVPDDAEIEADLVLEAVHEGILVTGTLRAPWRGACRRCLGRAAGTLVVGVRELWSEHGDDETTYRLEGDLLDLEPLVHDACILDLPLAPLCGEGCLGLCPECGADRNLEPCACVPAPDPRWAGLSVITGGLAEGGDGAADRRGAGDGGEP